MTARWRVSEPIAYGIDFGTTNSSIAVAYPDRIDVVPVESGSLAEILPSIVYLHRDRNRAAGREAVEQYLITGSQGTRCGSCEIADLLDRRGHHRCRQHRPGGGCQDARLLSGLKSDLANVEFQWTHSWAIDFKIEDLVAVVMSRLKREADHATGEDVRRAVIGHPVVFVGAEGREYRKRQKVAEARLSRAAARAGFEEVILLDEPAAAVMGEDLTEGIALAADFGGGTFDVAVLRFEPDGGEVIGLAGADIGGELFDRLLFLEKVAPALHLDDEFETRPGLKREVPNQFRKRLSTLSGLKVLLADSGSAAMLREFRAAKGGSRLDVVEEILYGGYAYGFYQSIEAAKIKLSQSRKASIEFHRPGLDISIPVERAEFEGLIAPHMDRVRREILTALEVANVQPDEVNLVLRTGGSSSIPAFVDILEDVFDPGIVQERPVYTTVVNGLATYAQGEWG